MKRVKKGDANEASERKNKGDFPRHSFFRSLTSFASSSSCAPLIESLEQANHINIYRIVTSS